MSFRFRNFPIYTELRSFIKDIYILANSLPRQEQFGLTSQLRRAATSVLLNIAEGSMKKSDAELNRFLLMAIGSIGEIVAILDLCLDQEYITSSFHTNFMIKCENIAKQLYGFSRKLKRT